MNNSISLFNMFQNLWKNIENKRRRKLFFIIALSILVSLFEVATIGSVIPYFGILMNPEVLYSHNLAQPFIEILNIKYPKDLLFPVTIFFCFVVTVATISRIILIWLQTKTGHNIGADFSLKIYENALYKSYDKFLLINSSKIISGISQKTTNSVYNVIFPIINFASSIIILFSISIILFFINFKITVGIIIIFIFVYSLVLILTRKKMKNHSLIADVETNFALKKLQEGLGSIRDILIGNFQSQYIKNFEKSDLRLRKALASIQILTYSPKFIVELIFIFLISITAYYLAIMPEGIMRYFPIFITYVVAGQRMLPHFQSIYNNISLVKSGKDTLLSVLDLVNSGNDKIIGSKDLKIIFFRKEIIFKNVFFSYEQKSVINNINLTIQKGSKIGIVGATGNGKSTFLDLLMGLLMPTKGKIMIDDKVLLRENLLSWQKNISHVPQNIFLSDASVSENIAFGIPSQSINLSLVEESAKIANLNKVINSWPDKYNTSIGEKGMQISGGERQRVGIARAMYRKSQILVLDEATNALDTKTELEIINSIFKFNSNLTIFIVSHRREILKDCDTIIEFYNGSIL